MTETVSIVITKWSIMVESEARVEKELRYKANWTLAAMTIRKSDAQQGLLLAPGSLTGCSYDSEE